MATQSKTRAERIRRIRAILDTAQALADGKDPADFPEFGFSPRVERLAEIFCETAHDRDEAGLRDLDQDKQRGPGREAQS